VSDVTVEAEVFGRVLLELAREWLAKNRSALGEALYERISRRLSAVNASSRAELRSVALWLYHVLLEHTTLAYTSRGRFEVWHIDEHLDAATTRRLLAAVHMCLR
jgi:hypothetical protein